MTTVNDIITRSMKSLQALGGNEVPSAIEASDGLTAFNSLLDSWTTEKLFSYEVQERSFPLVVGKSSYTIGTSGTPYINATRPQDIVQAYVQDSSNNNFPMYILPMDRWNLIGDRSTNITSQLPDTLFYDPQFPNGIINVYPTPLLTYTLFYDTVLNQSTFSSGTQTVSMPPGYERAYVSNLAMEMVLLGFQTTLDQKQLAGLMKVADESKGNIKRQNIKEVISEYDGSIISKSYATYNIFRDNR